MGYIFLQGYALFLATEISIEGGFQFWMPLIVALVTVLGAIGGVIWSDIKSKGKLLSEHEKRSKEHIDLSKEHSGIMNAINTTEKQIKDSVSSTLKITDLKVTDIKDKTEILNERIGHLYEADKRKEINMSYTVQDMLTNLQEQFIQQGKIIKYQAEQIQQLNKDEKHYIAEIEELQVNYRNSLNKITILEKKFIASSERGKELEKELESLKNPKSKKPSKGYDMDM